MAAILIFWEKVMSWSTYPKKVPLYMYMDLRAQSLLFQYGDSRHHVFGPLAKNAGIFGRDIAAICL